jgi:hypothetical protein
MSFRDKLEIGLKADAPYRADNLPESELRRKRKAPPSSGKRGRVAEPAAKPSGRPPTSGRLARPAASATRRTRSRAR